MNKERACARGPDPFGKSVLELGLNHQTNQPTKDEQPGFFTVEAPAGPGLCQTATPCVYSEREGELQ